MNIEEVRKAAAALARVNNWERPQDVYGEDYMHDYSEDTATLCEWAIAELCRRESERAERAKPIDAEWCLANGAAFDLGWMRFYGSECVVSWCESIVWVASKEWKLSMRKIKTRGQLLDLLAALKGGES